MAGIAASEAGGSASGAAAREAISSTIAGAGSATRDGGASGAKGGKEPSTAGFISTIRRERAEPPGCASGVPERSARRPPRAQRQIQIHRRPW